MKITSKADIVLTGSPDGRTGWDNTAEKMGVHHSAYLKSKQPKQFLPINQWHKERWPNFISSMGFYVGYNFVIQQGEIFQGRAVGEELAAHRGANKKYLATCFAGDYRTETLSQEDREAFKRLMGWLKELLGDDEHLELIPHSAISTSGTECPAVIDLKSLAEFLESGTGPETELGSNTMAIIKRLIELILRYLSTRDK